MREKSFRQLLDTFGPFDTYAQGVLSVGFQLANTKIASGPHILLASQRVDFVDYMRSILNSQHAREVQELQLQLQRGGLVQALRTWIDLPVDYSQDEVCTFGLHSALAAARAAAKRGNPISFFLLLRALLNKDIDVYTIMSTLDYPPSHYATWPSLPSMSSPIPGGIDGPFQLPARREATVSRRYASRHRIQMDGFLRELGERREDQVILARGPYGSPLQRLEYVLADILIDSQDGLLPDTFTDFTHVLMQSVSALQAAGIDGVSRSVENFRHSLSLARMWHAILMLTRGEDLLTNDQAMKEINKHLLEALLKADDVPIVIIYEDQSEFSFEKEIALPFVSLRVAEMPPYEQEHIAPAINDYYSRTWRSQGITTNDDALSTVFQLEPTIYAPSTRSGVVKRKVLPYSAMELLQQAVGIVQREIVSKGRIYDLARTAKQRLEKVLDDPNEGRMFFTAVEMLDKVIQRHSDDPNLVSAAQSIKTKWKPICDLLLSLRDRMQSLADQPVVDRASDGTYLVTDDIVTAQLFAEPTYHLRLVQAFEDSVKALEPQLLTLISESYEES